MGLTRTQTVAARERLLEIKYVGDDATLEQGKVLDQEAQALNAQLGQTRHDRRHEQRPRPSGAERRQRRQRGS